MILTTGKSFDRIRLESYPDYHGLVIEFQPDGHNAVSMSPVIQIEFGFIQLPNGKVGLSVQLPTQHAYRAGSAFLLVEDKLGAKKITLENGLELERLK